MVTSKGDNKLLHLLNMAISGRTKIPYHVVTEMEKPKKKCDGKP